MTSQRGLVGDLERRREDLADQSLRLERGLAAIEKRLARSGGYKQFARRCREILADRFRRTKDGPRERPWPGW